jgi:hypothetical protein
VSFNFKKRKIQHTCPANAVIALEHSQIGHATVLDLLLSVTQIDGTHYHSNDISDAAFSKIWKRGEYSVVEAPNVKV